MTTSTRDRHYFRVQNLLGRVLVGILFSVVCASTVTADWPMLRGEPAHTGFVQSELKGSFRLAWAREITGERLGTAMEPIVADGKLFVATHSGHLYALHSDTGDALWQFKAQGPFLQSPAVFEKVVVAGCTDGNLYGVAADTGKLIWRFDAGDGGFSASPVVLDGVVFIGTRNGDFLGIAAVDGRLLWRQSIGIPMRQTAAATEGRVFVTAEDLTVRCYRARDGELQWTSAQLAGQTARDYYPVVVKQDGHTYVLVRTNPILNMGQRIGRDRTLLCRNAGIDDSSWQKLEAWIKSDQAHGTPELWTKEQKVIEQNLQGDPEARTFFVLDADTGKEPFLAPILWVAGCQGVGAEPALTADGRLLVFRRTAYGNWNLGVAPLVGLGLYNLAANSVAPLFHRQGRQPPWNCFWGTADESQNFLVVGNTVLIIHQGTLSGFNLQTNDLFPIWGERDTYGGFRNPAWARNEWHGPGRGGVAVVGNRIYWQTGSRILCVVAGEPGPGGERPKPLAIETNVPTEVAPPVTAPDANTLRQRLIDTVETALARQWAPLFTDPGLAGRVFAFDQSGELFEALAWAYPHLPAGLQARAKAKLRTGWAKHPPFTRDGWYSLKEGARREWFHVPSEYCARLGADKQPHPFGNLYAISLYAHRCGEEAIVLANWSKLKTSFEEFIESGWRLDASKGDPFANRYLASLLAIERLAGKAGDSDSARQAREKADETSEALLAWWHRANARGTLKTFNTSSELDPFIGKGDGISLAVAPHRHKLALFQDLTPEVAALIRSKAPEAVAPVWATFAALCPTWFCMGEERQVHFGENFVDPPDLALSAFRAFTWLKEPSPEELARRVDLPFCRPDLDYIIKLALALEGRN